MLIKWSDAIDRAVRACGKTPLIEIDGVSVTKKELEVINGLDSVRVKRLAFTLLCVAKYWNCVRGDMNDGWVNVPDKDIMSMANIKVSVRMQSDMFRELRDLGLVRFSKRVDNLNMQVLFISDDDAEMLITDCRNLGNQFMARTDSNYTKCKQCGAVVRKKSNSQKYCKACAAEIYVKQSVESVMRNRVPTEKNVFV